MEVKAALRDHRFRESLPSGLTEDLQKYIKNPSCACNVPFYRRILSECADQLRAYFPGRAISNPEEEVKKLSMNNFSVINCHKDELEEKLRRLPPGRKQIAVARYEDQVTVVVNELDVIF